MVISVSKKWIIHILIISTLLLSGCWDQIEIERRAFVYGMAIDVAEGSATDNIKLTQQFINPENMATQGGGGGGKAYRNITGVGDTIYDINRDVSQQASRVTDANHLEVVLISEEFIKQPSKLQETLDLFYRGKRMRRGIKFAATKGEAKEYLSVDVENEEIPTQYLNDLILNTERIEISNLIRIGDIQEELLEKGSFPIVLLNKIDDRRVEIDGFVIYNGRKKQAVGSVTGEDAKGLSFIRNQKHNRSINIKMDDKPASIEILNIKRKFSLKQKDIDQLKFILDINIKATIGKQLGSEDITNFEVLKEVEELTKKEVEKMLNQTIEKLQQDFQTDGMGLWKYVSRFHPKIWEKIKEDWDVGENYFSKSEIVVNANVTIEQPGSINRTALN